MILSCCNSSTADCRSLSFLSLFSSFFLSFVCHQTQKQNICFSIIYIDQLIILSSILLPPTLFFSFPSFIRVLLSSRGLKKPAEQGTERLETGTPGARGRRSRLPLNSLPQPPPSATAAAAAARRPPAAAGFGVTTPPPGLACARRAPAATTAPAPAAAARAAHPRHAGTGHQPPRPPLGPPAPPPPRRPHSQEGKCALPFGTRTENWILGV